MGDRRRCNGNASHPSKRWSPKRFFISPNSTFPWDTWRRWRDTAAISSSLSADAYGTHLLHCDRFFSLSLSLSLSLLLSYSQTFIFYRIENAACRPTLCRNHFCRHRRNIIVRSFDKITDSWRVKFRSSSDLSLLYCFVLLQSTEAGLLLIFDYFSRYPSTLWQCAKNKLAENKVNSVIFFIAIRKS
jgi:hypothetical protein